MSYNYKSPVRYSRVQQHHNKRKSNFILNMLITIVFALILIVGAVIILDWGKTETTSGNNNQVETPNQNGGKQNPSGANPNEEDESGHTDDNDSSDPGSSNEDGDGNSNDENDNDQSEDPENGDSGDEIVEGDPNDPNVIVTITNPSWKAIGTEQTGQHTTNYSDGSIDRKEMEKALAYATNLQENDIIVWWLQRGEVPNRDVIGTITPKNKSKIYRVYLQWIDGEGWKPVKVQEIKESEKVY